MRFLVDECTGPAVTRWLSAQGHDAAILTRALAEDRVVVTNAKDFGEIIFREGLAHRGVILLRLADERAAAKIQVLHQHGDLGVEQPSEKK